MVSDSSIRVKTTIDAFFENLQRSSDQAANDSPDYWINNPQTLLTNASIGHFTIGTGEHIIKNVVPAILSAEYEVLIITCFWAKSASQKLISESLRSLANRARAERRLVHITICFSSRSLWQKLAHTSSLHGKSYPSSKWPASFGLPSFEELVERVETGLIGVSLNVKSIFVKPFSVMHPKFIVIDRKQVFLPSCNISWENWFEGCVELRGDVVANFVEFHQAFWAQGDLVQGTTRSSSDHDTSNHTEPTGSTLDLICRHEISAHSVPAIFLPSPHHVNPHFRPTCLLSAPSAPSTPLNIFLLTIFEHARNSIYIETPNLTSPPALDALYNCLKRGVNVEIITSSRMMVFEQLLTAGTVTELCVQSLMKRHKELMRRYAIGQDPEVALPRPGSLVIHYYKPADGANRVHMETEPVKSHLKIAIVDEYITVLGSGNMDRASWYTSQELGVAFFSDDLAKALQARVRKALIGRLNEGTMSGWKKSEGSQQ